MRLDEKMKIKEHVSWGNHFAAKTRTAGAWLNSIMRMIG